MKSRGGLLHRRRQHAHLGHILLHLPGCKPPMLHCHPISVCHFLILTRLSRVTQHACTSYRHRCSDLPSPFSCIASQSAGMPLRMSNVIKTRWQCKRAQLLGGKTQSPFAHWFADRRRHITAPAACPRPSSNT